MHVMHIDKYASIFVLIHQILIDKPSSFIPSHNYLPLPSTPIASSHINMHVLHPHEYAHICALIHQPLFHSTSFHSFTNCPSLLLTCACHNGSSEQELEVGQNWRFVPTVPHIYTQICMAAHEYARIFVSSLSFTNQ